ncbi:MAG TPA: glycosyltransferase family 4 protein [Candidatus Peribacteraceae bacterium]|nr:glycosyltransferase family 4 protein [Candidatus Peribacteraceae bacterium]
MKTILLISPYWKEEHRWMVSSYKLAELWQRLGYKVVVVCMGSDTKVEKVSDTLTVHFRKDVFLKDPLNFGISFGFAGYVRRVIADIQPDLVIVNKVLFWSSFALLPLRLHGIKALLLTDALVGITWKPRSALAGILMTIGAWSVGWMVLKAATRIVFFHPQPDNILKKLGIAGKSQVIPTGIDVKAYSDQRSAINKNENSISTERSSLSAGRSITVTYVGRLESVKGVDDFVAATVPLKKEFPDLTVQVVGWYKDNHDLVTEYGNDVQFTGLRSDIPEILSTSDIFVLPSYSEGLSNALMEAMASGCACIASDVGGNAFLIQNGVSGLLFPPGDREALRSHLRRLLQDAAKRRDMGRSARERIEKEFSWEVIGKKYQELFQENVGA